MVSVYPSVSKDGFPVVNITKGPFTFRVFNNPNLQEFQIVREHSREGEISKPFLYIPYEFAEEIGKVLLGR